MHQLITSEAESDNHRTVRKREDKEISACLVCEKVIDVTVWSGHVLSLFS